MTINTANTESGPYLGNDVTDQFSYTFKVEEAAQITVFETDDLGVQTELVLDTDYTVDSVGDDNGGLITRSAGALPTGYEWYIVSNYTATQLTEFVSQGAFFPETHEKAFDKLTMLVAQLYEKAGRALTFPRIPDETPGNILGDVDARTEKIIGFDESGEIEFLDNPTSAITAAADLNAATAATVTAAATSATGSQTAAATSATAAAASQTAAATSATAAAASAATAVDAANAATAGDDVLTSTQRKALTGVAQGKRVFDSDWNTTFTYSGGKWRMTPFEVFIEFTNTGSGAPVSLNTTIGEIEIYTGAYYIPAVLASNLEIGLISGVTQMLCNGAKVESELTTTDTSSFSSNVNNSARQTFSNIHDSGTSSGGATLFEIDLILSRSDATYHLKFSGTGASSGVKNSILVSGEDVPAI